MHTYQIGKAAERLLAVTIDCTGGIALVSRCRTVAGEWETISDERWSSTEAEGEVFFDVAVRRGDSGVVEILPAPPSVAQTRTLIPLGVDRPYLESDLPIRAGANGAYTQSESVRFRFTAKAVRWSTENMSGQAAFSERLQALRVVLRLPDASHGEITFSSLPTSTSTGRCIRSSSAGKASSSLGHSN